MSAHKISDLLKGQVPVGETVTVKGWVRTRRDSKAGLSFVQIHDGTAFDAIQAVVQGTIANYEDEILKLGAGCAVIVTGELATSQEDSCRT